MQRPRVLLLLLCSMPLSADALTLYDPKLCFILDGVLAVYGLFITAMFVREKFFRGKVKSDESLYTAPAADHSDSLYTGLNTNREDSEYRELPRRERQRKNEQVYQGLSAATRDTYDSLRPGH
ncbi:high affinity immunoglobulin epsilon receptor subunit gamma-like isoform X4 [Boleophthalmus pectinirostris]|uniref:high affinity immunoglobulin epsilon receptor subunit gamma-like isoform X4 n=1 Tax=Boleophthalmus pectinirostris TaxID=150288 RepID=UPI00242F87C3|nr:high affinity immunoglobulin epsilon receptor subunit gamma-like isoform X4 [Boleophthalmus pectinirostris]